MHTTGAKLLAFAIIENCVTQFPIVDRRTKISNARIESAYSKKCIFLETSPLIQMVADVLRYEEDKFRQGLRARLEKEFYTQYFGHTNIKDLL